MERRFQKTKIIATVGPACNTYEKLIKLVENGVDVFRLNFSHGSHEDHKKVIDIVRKINKEFPYKVALLADLQGPKLRIGEVENNEALLEEGNQIVLSNEKMSGTAEKLYLSYPNFWEDVKPGEPILLDDGKIELKILKIQDKEVVAEVISGGVIRSKKGINLPQTQVSLPALSEKDKTDLDFIAGENIDWVALSFVRKPEDVRELKELLKAKRSEAKVIAKIEKPEVLENLREVILQSDAIMVARGDLGVELPVEQIPMVQKTIIRKCLHRAKPVIIATQMMESMIDRTKPNRSEITDVANAVLEGADALMLSGETAVGQHPELVVKTMSNIISEVEKEEIIYNRNLTPQAHSPSFLSDALCYNACRIAEDVKCDALIGTTQSGYTGFMLSSFRPKSPLFVFTKTESLVHQLSLSWGVRAFFYDKENNLDEIIFDQIGILREWNFLKVGDVVVSTGSTPVAEHLPTNLIKVSRVGK